MNHPQLTRFGCVDCQKFVYDMDRGEPAVIDMPGADGQPVKEKVMRPKGTFTNCKKPGSSCPKGSPEQEWRFVMSDANRQLVSIVRRSSAPGFELPEQLRGCKVFQENYAAVREAIESKQRSELIEAVSLASLRRF